MTDHTTNTTKNDDREFDIVLYGATSFVGQLTAKYMAKFIKDKDINFAIAGRNLEKLSSLSSELNNPAVSLIIADSNQADTLDWMSSQTKVVISTVGPYTLYGEPLIKACVENGTDYIDLCGEMTFVKAMMDKYAQQAQQTGARIVPACGFDSIPSDLGVYYLQSQSLAKQGIPCKNVSLKVKNAKGGMSGGTLASMNIVMEQANANPIIKQQVLDPYLLIDDEDKPNTQQRVNNQASFDLTNKKWQTPFIMESTNSRVVHRSNYLSGFGYGRDFKYEEVMWFDNSLQGKIKAKGIAKILTTFESASGNAKWVKLFNAYLLPKPGQGPSVKTQENGFFDYRFYGYKDDNARDAEQVLIKIKVTGQKDPGYAGTAMMLSQAGLCLAFDIDKNDNEGNGLGGGFWSPAHAMGDKLIERLTAHAMMTFEQID